jgi:hypothetical protein
MLSERLIGMRVMVQNAIKLSGLNMMRNQKFSRQMQDIILAAPYVVIQGLGFLLICE